MRLVLDEHEGGREVHRAAGWGSSFGSLPRRLEIGVGRSRVVRLLEIEWPSTARRIDRYENVAVDQVLKVRSGTPELQRIALQRLSFAPRPEPP